MIDNGETITLYGRDSYNRGGAYVSNANISFANTGGAGSLVDNGDGTADYTAPGGSGTNAITVTVTNTNGSADGIIYVQYPSTVYDATVAEIASISGSIDQHGWKLLARVRGSGAGFVVGAGILLTVTDTWGGTTSTFGGYHYSPGVFRGYITEAQYFEDAFGETWLGIEVQSPWWMLSRVKIGQTWWGNSPTSIGMLYIQSFVPVDALWYIVNGITDFAKYHNCTFFYDQINTITDLIIDESDLATIIQDVMERTVCTAFTDRYGSLLCIPDPDVRADEWWGTPDPVFDSTAAGPLTQAYCQSYGVTYNPYNTRKIFAEALDSSKLGIFAISQSNSAVGDVKRWQGKLLCDNPLTLVNWVVALHAQANRLWEMDVNRHLDHTVDLMNFVDVNFTSPSQGSVPTASGQTYIQSINYRPDVFGGGWKGAWHLLKRTNTDTGGTSAWGGTGQFWTGVPGWSGGNQVSSWSSSGGVSSFCAILDFVNSGSYNFFPYEVGGGIGEAGEHVPGVGWSATIGTAAVGGTGAIISVYWYGPTRVWTGVDLFYSGASTVGTIHKILASPRPLGFFNDVQDLETGLNSSYSAWGANTAAALGMIAQNHQGNSPLVPGSIILSARVCGIGASPFGGTA